LQNLKRLYDNIEEVRGLLIKTIELKRGLTDPEILYISQQLDSLLNEYDKMKMNNKRKNYKQLRVI